MFVVLMVALAYAHVLYFAQRDVPIRRCDARLGVYLTFYGMWNLLIFGVTPSLLMLIFGLLTVRHIRRTMKRVAVNHAQTANSHELQTQHRPKTADRQLIQMLLAQCIVFSVTAAPSAINYVYFSVASSTGLDALQSAKLALVGNVVNYLSLTGPSLSFYLFTLSSQLFRRELMSLVCRPQITAMVSGNAMSTVRRN